VVALHNATAGVVVRHATVRSLHRARRFRCINDGLPAHFARQALDCSNMRATHRHLNARGMTRRTISAGVLGLRRPVSSNHAASSLKVLLQQRPLYLWRAFLFARGCNFLRYAAGGGAFQLDIKSIRAA
jgi:hypothetical protein